MYFFPDLTVAPFGYSTRTATGYAVFIPCTSTWLRYGGCRRIRTYSAEATGLQPAYLSWDGTTIVHLRTLANADN